MCSVANEIIEIVQFSKQKQRHEFISHFYAFMLYIMWILLATNFAVTFQLSGGALAFASTLWPTMDWHRLSDNFLLLTILIFKKGKFLSLFYPKQVGQCPVVNPWCQRGVASIIRTSDEISFYFLVFLQKKRYNFQQFFFLKYANRRLTWSKSKIYE